MVKWAHLLEQILTVRLFQEQEELYTEQLLDICKGKTAQTEAQRQHDIARQTNSQYAALGIGDTQLDLGVQPYQAKNGYSYGDLPSKEIEIEKGEIVTDEDYNIKAVGKTPHSKGGDDIIVEQGDTVFPTQKT